MAPQGNPPPQNYGNPQPGNFYVGQWLFYWSPFNRYFWEGNGPVGYVGGPATYTYIPYPGTNPFPWLPAPATPPVQTPQTPPPPPAPPATGVPAQSNPPITGDHRDDPRKSACGPAMSVPKESGVDGDYGADGGKYCGYGADDALGVPVVAAMHSLPVHTTETWLDTDTPNKYISYDRHPYLKKDELGRYSAVHNGMASGVVVFAPPQIQDFHCYGDSTLRDSQWPVRISSSTFLLFNGATAGIASFAKTYLAFGTAHPTSVKPKLGWYFDLHSNTSLTLADTLSLVSTKSDATDITDPSDYPTFDIKADVHVRGKLTVDGIIDPTGLVLTEQASTPWTAAAGYGALYVKNTAPSTLIFVDDTGAEITLGAGVSGNEVTQAATTTSMHAVFVGETGNRARFETPVIIDKSNGNTSGIGTLASGAHKETVANVTASNRSGVDSTKGPWRQTYFKDMTTSGGGVQTVMDVPIPTSCSATIAVRLYTIAPSSLNRVFLAVHELHVSDNAGTPTIQLDQPVIDSDPGGIGYAISFVVSTTNVRIQINDATNTLRLGCSATIEWRNATA